MMADGLTSAMMGAFMVFFTIITGIILILWIILPFSVFGIKRLIREAIEEQKKTNEMLKQLISQITSSRKEPPSE